MHIEGGNGEPPDINKDNDFSDATDSSNRVNTAVPPSAPSLLQKSGRGATFGVPKQKVDTCQELKSIIEYLLSKGKNGNDIALFYKQFISVLFSCGSDIQLLKWQGSMESSIIVTGDIA